MDPDSPTVDVSNLPANLICEQCGVNPVNVIITRLSDPTSDRVCDSCAIVMFCAIANGIAEREMDMAGVSGS